MEAAGVATVRRFSRVVTQRLGALNDEYLARPRPLGASRVLYEVGEAGADARTLRSRLGLDSGYLSRLLRSLEQQQLVVTGPDACDKRVRRAELTTSGLRELRTLNRDSDRLANDILEPLNGAQRARLTTAMAEVARLLTASAVQVEQVAPTSRDAEFCLDQYFAELAIRFDVGFDPALSLSPTHEEFAPPSGTFLVMRLHGRPVGCGGFKRESEGAAYIKRMWVSNDARGLGLGRRLLQELERRARSLGYRKLRLETQKSLTEAQQLYRSSGFREVSPFNDEAYAHHWFEKAL